MPSISLPVWGARGWGPFVGGELNAKAAVFPVSVVTQQDGTVREYAHALFCWLRWLGLGLTARRWLGLRVLFVYKPEVSCLPWWRLGLWKTFYENVRWRFHIRGCLTLQSLAHYAPGICSAGLFVSGERWYKGENKWRVLRGGHVWARERGEAFLWNSHFVQIKKVELWGESFMGESSWIIWKRGVWHSTGWSRSLFPVSNEESLLKALMNWSRGESASARAFRGAQVCFLGRGWALFSNPIEGPSEGRRERSAEKSEWNVTTGKCHWWQSASSGLMGETLPIRTLHPFLPLLLTLSALSALSPRIQKLFSRNVRVKNLCWLEWNMH